MENVKTINYFINYECDEWLLVNKNIILMVNPNKNQLKFVISAIYKIFYIYIYICRVTNCSPHLDGNRRWAQQAQYNKFVREWVKELG